MAWPVHPYGLYERGVAASSSSFRIRTLEHTSLPMPPGRPTWNQPSVIPLLIGFGLLSLILLIPKTVRLGKHDDRWAVGWLIILLTIGLVAWGLIPQSFGLNEGIYR